MRIGRTSAFGLWAGAIALFTLVVLHPIMPTMAQNPSTDVSAGQAIYEHHCIKCHGQAGRGDGPQAQWQMVRPTNFPTPASRSKSDEQLLSIIQHGLIFSPMHEWRDRLSLEQQQDVLAYIRLLSEHGR